MKRLLIDMSSILRALHFVGEDVDNGYSVEFEGKRHNVNSAEHAYENFMQQYRLILNQFDLRPFQTVAVLDGKNSRQLRQSIFPAYKTHRKASPPEVNKEFFVALEGVVDEITALGGMAVWQDGMEADDVIAYLAQNLEAQKLIWTRDKDMTALQCSNVDVYCGNELNTWINPACPPEFVSVYKALCGDSSDGFPGAKGFGPGAFEKFVLKFGLEGLEMMRELIRTRKLKTLEEDVAEFKPLQKIIDSAKDVYTSYACACFYPERINTSANPLQVRMQVAPATHEDFQPWFQTKKLAVPADAGWITAQLQRSPHVALDIETFTPPKSDEWVRRLLEHSKGRKKTIVDVFGSKLAGMSLTFGDNLQHTVYMPITHGDCELWTDEQVMDIVGTIPEGVPVLAHNAAGFELPVLYNNWGAWVEGMWDTKDMASYVNENLPLGLKDCAKTYLGYDQATYEQVTQGRKMNELTGTEVLDYACDDTIVCASLYNRFLFTMELEKTTAAFRACELESSYWVARAYVRGIAIDWEKLARLKEADAQTYLEQEEAVLEYLKSKGWPGTEYRPFEDTVAGIKAAFQTVTGKPLETRVRKLEKLIAEVREQGASELADALETLDREAVDRVLLPFFTGVPEFDANKDAQLRTLMYEVMSLPIRFRTRPTDNMRAKGIWEGTPQVDLAAVEHALKLDLDENSENYRCLKAIREMKACATRDQLYYTPYPLMRHWKDGLLHPSLGKNMTATRRFAPSGPNINQLPKRKDGGRIRSVFITPTGYIWASFDWSGQELCLAAERSGDEKLTACYIGEQKFNPHALTASGIAKKDNHPLGDYQTFMQAKDAGNKDAKVYYDKGKAVNFSSQYLCRAPKLGKLLVVDPDEAQKFLDAKNSVFWGLAQWQQDTIAACHARGYATTLLSARRHLHEKLTAHDKWVVNKAERQGVNFEIQGSGAEMAKCSISAMHRDGGLEQFGAYLVFPVHDEGDFLIPVENATPALQFIHRCMTQRYADMKIPVGSDCSIGLNFGELINIGSEITEDKVNAVLKGLGLI